MFLIHDCSFTCVSTHKVTNDKFGWFDTRQITDVIEMTHIPTLGLLHVFLNVGQIIDVILGHPLENISEP